MIKLGDVIELKEGFPYKDGTCKRLELLKWSEEDAFTRGHKYLVLGAIHSENSVNITYDFVCEGSLTECRRFIQDNMR